MKIEKQPKTFRDAVNFFGGVTKTAKALGISVQSASFYRDGERKVSPEVATKVHLLTNGFVRRQDLFPDNWQAIWPELVEAA